MKPIIPKIVFTTLLAFTINSFIYFSFGNIYSSKIINYSDFSNQFGSGIYQYRILSEYFLFWIYDLLSTLHIDYQIFKLKFSNPSFEPQMYMAFYILNTFFLILSSIMMIAITESKNFVATNSEKLLLISVGVFTIAFSQFVIVPYDCSSYFFILFFFWIFLKYIDQKKNLLLMILVIIIIISTFNRESSAISVSLAATLLLYKYGYKKEIIFPILILGITFITIYLGMRILNQSFSTNDGNLLSENLTQPKNLLGLIFWVIFFTFTLILSKNKEAKKNIFIFHLFSFPYIAMCFYSGIIYEARLYVPLFLTSLFLGRITTNFSSEKLI